MAYLALGAFLIIGSLALALAWGSTREGVDLDEEDGI